jgi:NAD(P)-dependent dehydrogenase (short-subunit alcohol dehydrogenase family)/SAM-dependent methyltransferase
LTGEYIRLSVRALAPGGSFVELGKRDVWTQEQVDSLRRAGDVRLQVVAIDKMLADDPMEHARLLRDVERELAAGWYRPIPTLTFPFADISKAFTSMRHGQHVGKVVLQLQPTTLSDVRGYSVLADIHGMDRALRDGMSKSGRNFFSTTFDRSELLGGLEAANSVARAYLSECMSKVHSSQVAPRLHSLYAAYTNSSARRVGAYTPTASSLSQEARSKYPSIAARLDFLEHVSRSHVDMTTGKVDATAVLFSDQALTSRLYNESPMAALFNKVVDGAFCAIQTNLVEHGASGLRALEIGAGTGGTTRAVMGSLAAVCKSFCFTDLSASFFPRAQREFKGMIPGFSTALLNIEHSPERQGFTLASYDVILAANVLHATSNLVETVKNVCALLKPGGLLVLSELTAPSAWADATFGFAEGWWRSTDERRAQQPLVSVATWNNVFLRAGLEPYAFSDETISAQTVMVAKRPLTQLKITSSLQQLPSRAIPIDQGSFVITGGTGGLGLLTAWLLVLQGASRIALLSRSGRVPGKEEEVIWDTIQRSRAHVTVHRCDVGDEQQVKQVLQLLGKPVIGIIHAAGHLRDASIANQSASTFDPVMRTKAGGLLNLHHASLEMPHLRSFVVFSSAAAFFGSAGQTNHASANAFMDNLVRWRRRSGLPASSVMWGAVSQIGDAARRGVDRRPNMLYDALSLHDAIQTISSVLLGDFDVVLAAPLRLAAIDSDYRGNKRIFANLEAGPAHGSGPRNGTADYSASRVSF